MAANQQAEHRGSWFDRVLDRVKPQPGPPPRPTPPPVDKTQWERSLEAHEVDTLTIHDVGLIVFNETQSLSDSDHANDTIHSAREKVAHALINADSELGRNRPPTAHPIEPTPKAMKNAQTRQAYDSSLAAARQAYLASNGPSHGAINFNLRPDASRSNFRPDKAPPPGKKIKTQSGPFNNSYPTRGKNGLPSRGIYVNTYGLD
jgi:hypothetical protein